MGDVRVLRVALAALLLSLLLALPALARAADEAESETTPLVVVSGTIRSVDLETHALVIDVDDGTATLGLDRNTLVYLPEGLATVAALRAGDEVRAGRNGRNVAYWIQVRRASAGVAR